MFRIMKSQISGVLKQAITTFTSKQESFQTNLDVLKTQLSKITERDVNLNPNFMSDKLWQKPNKAPVTYIDIYEDSNLTMGIFVLKPGMKLPLHNHPDMHGLIRVIYGKVKIRSYSINTPKTKEVDEACGISNQKSDGKPLITAELCPEVIADVDSECCLLKPDDKNLHEIETIQGPAAFIDILAPPYETVSQNAGFRQCRYFEVKQEVTPGIVRLQEIKSPSWYWTDSYCYDGPEL